MPPPATACTGWCAAPGFYLAANNLFEVGYLSRLKYAGVNNVTGRRGVFNTGRNVSVKLLVPLAFD